MPRIDRGNFQMWHLALGKLPMLREARLALATNEQGRDPVLADAIAQARLGYGVAEQPSHAARIERGSVREQRGAGRGRHSPGMDGMHRQAFERGSSAAGERFGKTRRMG